MNAKATTMWAAARECVEKAGGNWDKACAALRRRAQRDRVLREELLNYSIRFAVREVDHTIRDQYKSAAKSADDDAETSPRSVPPDKGIRGVRRKAQQDWLLWPTSITGKYLGDCTKAEVARLAHHHELHEMGNRRSRLWYQAVYERMGNRPDHCLVKTAMTNEDLAALSGILTGQE